MKSSLLVARSGLLVGALLLGACSAGPRDFCVDRKVTCEGPQACDPSDGVCKCGGRGGIVCPSGFSCDPVSNTCLSSLCAGKDCTDQPGTSCDRFDGQCKCGGTGGLVCAQNERCDGNARACVLAVDCSQVACPANQVCEQSTGRCLCGTAVCGMAQVCSGGTDRHLTCVDSACVGVTCTGTSVCDPMDGQCKCNGAVCRSGESCSCAPSADGGCADAARTCRVGNACVNSNCQSGTTCDPADGQCKCGGPGGPTCGAGQTCRLTPSFQCMGGQQCTQADGGFKLCLGGTSCDPEDGQCKCGGRGGVRCAPAATDGGTTPAEICVQNPVQLACRRPCDVRSPDCQSATYCYFDSSAATPAAYCALPTAAQTEEAACTTATACFSTNPAPRSLHCLGLVLGQTGLCRSYCDVAAGTAGCTQVPRPQTCAQIPQAPTGFGFCNPN